MPPEMFGRDAAATWETPRDEMMRLRKDQRDEQVEAGQPREQWMKVEEYENYTEEDFEAFLRE